MAKGVYLTTKDNPFDPRDQFDDWYAFDVNHGYNTCGYLARITDKYAIEAFPEEYNNEAIETAIDEIIEVNNDLGNYIYKKVVKEDEIEAKDEENLDRVRAEAL